MICRKNHLPEDSEYLLALNRLTAAWETIQRNGTDEPSMAFQNSQESDYLEAFVDAKHKCVGYDQMNGETACGLSCKIELFLDLDVSNRHYFCKPSHLMRYLLFHYGVQGKNCHNNCHRGENQVKKGKKKNKNKKASNAGEKSSWARSSLLIISRIYITCIYLS